MDITQTIERLRTQTRSPDYGMRELVVECENGPMFLPQLPVDRFSLQVNISVAPSRF